MSSPSSSIVYMSKTVDFRVVGLTFIDGYPENLHRLRDTDEERRAKALLDGAGDFGDFTVREEVGEPLPVVLIRNPENEHDENAIEVHVPVLGRVAMIGHVPRTLAAKLAPSLDRGDTWAAALTAVLIDPEHPDRPGALVTLTCVAKVARENVAA